MKNALSQRSRLAADWVPSEEESLAIQAALDAPKILEDEDAGQAHEEEEVIDPRWLRGGASYQRFSHFETDEEEEEARQTAREKGAWDPNALWVEELIQPAEIGSIPRGKGSRSGKRRRTKVLPATKQTEKNDDNPAQECVRLYRFRPRVSPGEYYFYEIRPNYKLIVVRRYLEEVRINGFDRCDMGRRFVTEGISRNRQLSMYVEEYELKELAIFPAGATRALVERARAEDPIRVDAVDRLARRPRITH